ncbi:MAG: 23S rRNA (guanosine(2251)-2'-O)-methyltransferase RlmB [Candidatus Latescibacteria bacterium]|jgi:23S rRNA (guanosine2251-2'-O)-methyltransferase|nr:23S rRNA (guanosine(2251)-2'-O)-methyltransferase RlmB [Candidatus Latescibacterota bacterium]
MPIYLKNPHSILAVLEKRAQDIIEIRLPSKQAGDAWKAVQEQAEQIGIRTSEAQPQRSTRRNRRDKSRPGRIGEAEASVKEHPGIDLSDLFANVSSPSLYLALDTVQDPQNLGAIFRTAAFFGVRGILLTRDRSASLTGTVYDVASGGVEHVPFSIQTNLSRALDTAKDAGLWILGTSEHAEKILNTISADRPWLLVLGNEETGIRRLTRDKCDDICQIAPRGAITSLNVSTAAGICIHHLTHPSE